VKREASAPVKSEKLAPDVKLSLRGAAGAEFCLAGTRRLLEAAVATLSRLGGCGGGAFLRGDAGAGEDEDMTYVNLCLDRVPFVFNLQLFSLSGLFPNSSGP